MGAPNCEAEERDRYEKTEKSTLEDTRCLARIEPIERIASFAQCRAKERSNSADKNRSAKWNSPQQREAEDRHDHRADTCPDRRGDDQRVNNGKENESGARGRAQQRGDEHGRHTTARSDERASSGKAESERNDAQLTLHWSR